MVRNGKRWIAVAGLTLFVSAIAWAASAADGKWTWKQRGGQGGNEVGMTLELKADDAGKLTGTVMREGADQKTEIKEGTLKGSDISFAVVRERNGQEFKTLYAGKIEGDSIKGTMKTNRGGEERTTEWVANKSK